MGQQVLPTLSAEMRLETGGLSKDAAAIIAQQEKIGASGVAAAEKVDEAMKRAGNAGAVAMAKVVEASQSGAAQSATTWRQFTADRMAEYMKLEGSHAAAMKRMGAEWQEYKTAGTVANSAVGNASSTAIEKMASAVRDAAKAGVDLPEIAKATAAAYVQSGEISTAAQRKIEQAGERLIAQYERQTAVIGKSGEELRRAKAEELALAAERSGQIDLATRIRAAEQAMWDAEYALARRQRAEEEALAEERAAAAAQAAQQAAEQARAMELASAAHKAFEAAARAGMQAMREQEAEAERLAGAAARLIAVLDPVGAAEARLAAELGSVDQMFLAGLLTLDQYVAAEERARAQLDSTTAAFERQTAAARDSASVPMRPVGVSTVGTGDFAGAGSARASVEAFEELIAAQEQVEQRVKALTAALDPQAAALARANALVKEATELDDGSAAAADRLAKAQANLARAHELASKSAGQNSFALTNLSFQLNDVATMAAMGWSPMQILATQGGQIFQAFQMAEGGAKTLARQILQLTVAYAPLIAVGAVLAAGVVAWEQYSAAVSKMTAISRGAGAVIGVTGTQLEQISERAAAAANVSVGAARDIVTSYVQAGGIGKDVLGGLVGLTEGFAKATGTDAAEAQKTLAAAFQDPVKGAEDLTTRYGSLTQAQIEHIRQLVDQNDKYGAQAALLAALRPQFDGAAQHALGLAGAWQSIATAASNAWTSMGKAIAVAMGGGAIMDQIAHLQAQRALGPSLGQWATGTTTASFNADIDKQIAALRAQLAQEQARAKADAGVRAGNTAVQVGMGIAGASTGAAEVDSLRVKLGQVNTALSTLQQRGQTGTAAYQRLTTAQQQYEHAVSSYLPAADKAAKLAELDAKAEGTKDPVQKRAIATQKAMLEQSGQLVTADQARAKATADGAKAYTSAQNSIQSAADSAAKKAANHAAELQRAADAEESQIRNLGLLATAYGKSGAAALIAEATERAESKAIKDRGDIAAETDRQIRLSIAQRITDASKATASMNDQAAVQERVNAQVEAGLIPAAAASQMVQDQIALLPLQAAQQAALDKVKDATAAKDQVRAAQFQAQADQAKVALDAETEAQKRRNAAALAAQVKSANIGADNQVAMLQAELRLVGATDAARVHELATIKAQQDAEAMRLEVGTAAYDEFVSKQVAVADGQQQLKDRQDGYNASLIETADHWDIIAGKVQSAGQGMADAFGTAGRAIGDLASTYANYMASQSRMEADHNARVHDAGTDQVKLAQEAQRYALQSSGTQIAAYGDMISSAKGFFKTGTAGYSALAAAEKVYRVAQLAMSIQAMVQQVRETVTHVASSGARATANAAEGVSAQAKLTFPFNLVAMAATAAALVAAGIAVIGGSGGGASQIDKGNTGVGTVLGDTTKGSDSIKNSIDALSKIDLLTNTYSREMAASLKSIDSQIGSFAAEIVKGGDISNSASIATGFKTSGFGSILSNIPLIGGFLSSLFGTRTDLLASGLYGAPQTLGQINSSGYTGQSYNDIQKVSKFLGIVTGRSNSTQYGGLDPSINDQFTLILQSFDKAIAAAAGPLGEATDAVQAKLDGFVVNLGKIDLTGLSGDDIEKKLENVFGALGDQMASFVYPTITKYQKVGEGALETLTRVASTVEAVTTALDELGTGSANLGIDAKMGLASQFDSLSDMSSAIDGYFTRYYTDAEQAAAKTAQMGKVFDSLGLQMPDTLDGFRQLVEAQDLTTASGQSTYATLLQLAPAFADLKQTMDGAKSAADVLSERMDLERQLLQLQGDTDAIRALDLQKLDESNRALQQQVWALSDAKDAADKAAQAEEALASQRAGLEGQILQLQGDTAAIRQRELDALDPSLRALQERIYALTDEQAATQAAAAAAEAEAQRLAAVASERLGLENQLLALQGDVAAQRERELATLDPTNRAIQQQIYALTDLQAAQQAATEAAQEAAQKADAIAQERMGLEDQIFQLEGNTAAQRYKALEALDATNRPLQEYIYALQDQQAATAAATQAAEEAAQAEAAIAQERAGLMNQLWQLTGDTASIRAAALAALDPSNRALQEQIWAVQDAQAAAKAAADLSSAWKSIGDTITDEVNRIRGLNDASTAPGGYAALKGQFNAAVAAALAGDQTAAKNLPGLSKSLLDAAATSATSSQELARIQAETAAMLESVTNRISYATGASDFATAGLTNDGAVSIDGASWWSQFAGGADAPARIAANDDATVSEIAAVRDEMVALRKEQSEQMNNLLLALATIAGSNQKAANALTQALGLGAGDGLAVVVKEAA